MKELLHTLFRSGPAAEDTLDAAAVPSAPPADPAPAGDGAPVPPAGEAPAPLPRELPAGEPAADELRLLRSELESLRREKHAALLREEAEALLTRQGLDRAFAPFVLGPDLADTRQRAEQFQRLFARVLRQELARRPLPQEPRDFLSPPRSARRGVHRPHA